MRHSIEKLILDVPGIDVVCLAIAIGYALVMCLFVRLERSDA